MTPATPTPETPMKPNEPTPTDRNTGEGTITFIGNSIYINAIEQIGKESSITTPKGLVSFSYGMCEMIKNHLGEFTKKKIQITISQYE